MISFLWAEDKNHVIGENGHLPWSLPNDMKRFKELSVGKTIVMGRKTYQSFPNGPLPKRLNIVMSHDKNFTVPESVILINDKNQLNSYVDPKEEIVIIGGRQIFELFKDDVDILYVTKIDHAFKGDIKMIDLDYDKFELTKKVQGIVDKKNIYPYTFEDYKRI